MNQAYLSDDAGVTQLRGFNAEDARLHDFNAETGASNDRMQSGREAVSTDTGLGSEAFSRSAGSVGSSHAMLPSHSRTKFNNWHDISPLSDAGLTAMRTSDGGRSMDRGWRRHQLPPNTSTPMWSLIDAYQSNDEFADGMWR